MSVATVVLLRRLPPGRSSFEYFVPADQPASVGQLVTVPFRRQRVFGIVRSIADDTTQPRLRPLGAAHELRLTPWQRQVAELMSATHPGSLGQVLKNALPLPPRRSLASIRPSQRQTQKPGERISPAEPIYWYRDRRQALASIGAWAKARQHSGGLVIVPTKDDGQQIRDCLVGQGLSAWLVHGDIRPAEFRRCYAFVAERPVIVIGTWRALLLPYTEPPAILLDQEEHPAHKQMLQQPWFDTRDLLRKLKLEPTVTTPAPSLTWCVRHRPAPPPDTRPRILGALGTPGGRRWLSPAALELLERAHRLQQSIVCIVPRRGFARLVECADCGWTFSCPHCRRYVRLRRSPDHLLMCDWCRQSSRPPSVCPRCQGTRWRFPGLGPEQFQQQLQQAYPSWTILPLVTTVAEADVFLDTYQAYRLLPELPSLAGVIIVSGDGLRNVPDYTTDERAWQYLNRLQSAAPTVPLVTQTFQPDSEFWQRWLHHDDERWYRQEEAERRRRKLPPFVDQWIVRYGSPRAKQELAAKLAMLRGLELAQVDIRPLPPRLSRAGQPFERLLLTAPGRLADLIDWTTLFPTPWQVDQTPDSWLA